MKDRTNARYPYRKCEVRDRKGDLSKRWYVEFYVFDVATCRKIRKTDYSINKYNTAKERYQAAGRIKSVIDKKLEEGAFVDTSGKVKQKRQDITPQTPFVTAIERIFQQRKIRTNSKRTGHTYTSHENILKEWATIYNANVPVSSFEVGDIVQMMDWYKSRINPRTGNVVTNRSYNNLLLQVRSIFNDLVRRKCIWENPAHGVKPLKESTSAHVPYTDNQVSVIKDYLTKHDPQLLLVCQCIYYLFIRRSELQHMQVGWIKENKVLIPDMIYYDGKTVRGSKNGRSEYVRLPKSLLKIFKEKKIIDYPPEYFIFTTQGKPGKQPPHVNYFTNAYKKMLDALQMNGGQSLYSWKHTGVCKLYKKFKDPKMVQEQCRHSKLETTLIYLRDLGMFDEGEVEKGFPEF